MSEYPIIEVRNLFKSYKSATREVHVLNDVTLKVEAGDMVALLGASGSGKTSLLNVLGLVTDPTSGSVFLNNQDVFEKGIDREELRRSAIGYIYQQFLLLPQFSALDNVRIPLVPVNKKKLDATGRAKELLNRMGLSGRYDHLPSELSGGEQQRVAIARALIHSPKILLCDEPTGNLDTAMRDSIMDLLSELNHEGLTIILVTHDETVANRCNVRYHITDGKITEI